MHRKRLTAAAIATLAMLGTQPGWSQSRPDLRWHPGSTLLSSRPAPLASTVSSPSGAAGNYRFQGLAFGAIVFGIAGAVIAHEACSHGSQAASGGGFTGDCTLTGGLVGGAAGGLLGFLVGWSIPRRHG